jgi:hypothetical protein
MRDSRPFNVRFRKKKRPEYSNYVGKTLREAASLKINYSYEASKYIHFIR